jgi:hypothetical protein
MNQGPIMATEGWTWRHRRATRGTQSGSSGCLVAHVPYELKLVLSAAVNCPDPAATCLLLYWPAAAMLCSS